MTTETRIDKAVKIMMITGFSCAIAMLLLIVGTALYMVATGKPVPPELRSWADTSLGFLFGALMGLVKDWMARA